MLMLKRIFLAMAIATVAVSVFFVASDYIGADSSPGIALIGQVSSEREGLMEGVLVSVKKDDSTITITVVSDEKGRYGFPRSKVALGYYSLKICAVGYDLDGVKVVDVVSDKATTVD